MSPEPQNDPRFYLAEERTFLAWIRTGLSLMGFGFVAARFGLFLKELQIMQHQEISRSFSVAFGTTLVLLGVAMNVIATFRHVRTVRKIRNREPLDQPSFVGIGIALVLALVGVAMAIHLLAF